MPDWLAFLVTIAAAAAAVFGYLALQRLGQKGAGAETASLALREEAERVRRMGEDQARGLRQEIGESVRGSHESTLALFRELSNGLSDQSRRASEQLKDGLRSIEARFDALQARLPRDVETGGYRADHDQLRQEIAREGHRLTEALFKSMMELRAAQAAEAEALSRRLSEARELIQSSAQALEETLRQTLAGVGSPRAPDRGVSARDETLPSSDIADLKEALTRGLERIEKQLTESLSRLGVQQVGRLEQVSRSLEGLRETQETDRSALREAIESALGAIRRESANKAEELKRLKALEAENARLRVAVAELTLEKITLGEGAKPGD